MITIKNAGFVILCCIFVVFAVPYLFTDRHPEPFVDDANKIKVYNHISDEVCEYNLEEYVWRVVAGEMYYSYNPEALKAQAVAVRTYAMKKADSTLPEHKGGDVCTNSAHCMAFVSEEDAKAKWGDKYSEISEKFKKSAYETAGEVITYNDEYATAVFHAISSGTTESAKDVWGGNAPYLSNNDSSLDKNAKGYKSTAEFTFDELYERLGITADDFKNAEVKKTAAGGIKSITAGEKSLSGAEIRKMLGLRSANFEYEIKDNIIHFTVYGYGHGIGMSQAGANEYANAGYTYSEILKKYYPGTILEQIKKGF